MMRKAAVVLSLALIMLFVGSIASYAADAAGLIKEGDSWYAQRGDMAKAKMSAESYRKAMAADPKSAEAAWKLARTLYDVGRRLPEDQQIPVFEEGIAAAKKAIELQPNNIDAHYWLGVSYGLYGTAKGVLKSLSLVDPIKKEMAFVIQAQPDYAQGGAYRVLGRLYFKVPGMFGGDEKKSEENLKTALKYGPQSWLTHVYLAELYMKQKRNDEAKALLQQAIAGPCQAADGPACADWKKDAQALLAKIK